MIAKISLLTLVLLASNSATMPEHALPPQARFPVPCAAIAPTAIRSRSVTWLGACIEGKAEGLGILRVGARAPFSFLIGRMKAGKPDRGLIWKASGDYQDAMGFDAQGNTIPADGEHMAEQDEIWEDAVRTARLVADRFEFAGNKASASYYRRFAYRIEHGRPE